MIPCEQSVAEKKGYTFPEQSEEWVEWVRRRYKRFPFPFVLRMGKDLQDSLLSPYPPHSTVTKESEMEWQRSDITFPNQIFYYHIRPAASGPGVRWNRTVRPSALPSLLRHGPWFEGRDRGGWVNLLGGLGPDSLIPTSLRSDLSVKGTDDHPFERGSLSREVSESETEAIRP